MKVLFFALALLLSRELQEQIEADREARDRELRSPQFASPLTAMDRAMIELGHGVFLSECSGKVRFTEDDCQPLLEIRFEGRRFLAKPLGETRGLWGPATAFRRELSIVPGHSDIRGRLLLTDPEQAQGLALFFSLQGGLGRVMLHDTRSPTLTAFSGLDYYPVDPRYRFVVPLQENAEREVVEIATTRGSTKELKRLGTVTFDLPEGRCQLTVFVPLDSPRDYFVPFRDSTNGEETYLMGRYLYLTEGPEPGTFVLDFNRAFNPYCAYSPLYDCPYPPPENHLDARIPAGEKRFKRDWRRSRARSADTDE
ncbi:MAG: DUF1684 domain-containing protein, partial [Acidobacteriota bacterium]